MHDIELFSYYYIQIEHFVDHYKKITKLTIFHCKIVT